jgi:hypothetical protein
MVRTLALAAALLGLCACGSDSQADSSSKTSAHHVKAVGHMSGQHHSSAAGVIGQVVGNLTKHQAHAHSHPRR